MSVHRKACRDCNHPIELRRGGDAVWRPYDPDGSLHDCPARGGHRLAAAASPHPDRRGATGAAAGLPVGVEADDKRRSRWTRTAGTAARPSLPPAAFLVVGALGLLIAWWLVPRGGGSGGAGLGAPAVGQAIPAEAVLDADGACSPFDAQVWAQTVFDDAPLQDRALDPDGDGLACEDLPPGAAPALWTDDVPAGAEPAALVETIDGDTIEVRREDGAVERVRLVGIDTPETGLGSQPLECHGPEASRFATSLLGEAGGIVYLEKDVEERDRYDRLLRWVWFEADGRPYLANEAIARSGFAERYRDTPNRRHLDRVAAAEAFAREHGYGMWGACG